jgi:hypothetical protein
MKFSTVYTIVLPADSRPNPVLMENVHDPIGTIINLVVDIHKWLESDNSGTLAE